jgi:hypothetical protein
MKKYLIVIIKLLRQYHLLTVFALVSAQAAFSQRTATTSASSLSAGDKRDVIALFSNADRQYHRLQFAAGKEVYGSRTINSTESERIRKASLQEKGIIIICKESNSAILYFKDGSIIMASSGRAGTNPFLNLLGKEKTEKLKKIMAKYIEDPDINNLDKPNLLGAPDT